MPRYQRSHAQGPRRSVFGCAEKAVGQLQSCGKKRILCERNARPPQVLERPVLSFPLGVLRGCPLSEGCERGSEADFAGAFHNVCFVPGADINHHLFSAVVIALIRLVQFGGPVGTRPSTPWLARYSQQLLPLFYLPGGLVVVD